MIMAISIWKGHISFGMVSFPVRLYAAARSQALAPVPDLEALKSSLARAQKPAVDNDGRIR